MIDFSKTPPKEQQRVPLGIVRVRPGQPLKVVHLSHWFYGMMSHYVGKRTVYCPGPETCPWCDSQGALWKGHAVVRAFNSDKIALLQITPNVWPTIEKALAGRESAAGLVACYERRGKEKNSPLVAQTFGFVSVERQFSFDQTAAYVKRIFRQDVGHTLLVNMRDVEEIRGTDVHS